METVSLWQPSHMLGRADREVHESWTESAWQDVIIYLAGPIAELRWRRHCRAAIWFGAKEMAERCLGDDEPEEHSDFGRVRRRLTCAVPGDDRANFVKAWLEAEEKVAHWWNQIGALARTLNECGRLEDDDIYAMWDGLRERRATGMQPSGG